MTVFDKNLKIYSLLRINGFMAAIVKTLQDIENSEKEKIIPVLKEASKEHSGEVLLARHYGCTTFTLEKNYVSKETKVKSEFPIFRREGYSMGKDELTYNQFVKDLSLNELKEVAERLAKLGL